MSFLDWYAQQSRNFACAVDGLIPNALGWIYGGQVAEGYYSALNIFTPSPCGGGPTPPPPQPDTFPQPACSRPLWTLRTVVDPGGQNLSRVSNGDGRVTGLFWQPEQRPDLDAVIWRLRVRYVGLDGVEREGDNFLGGLAPAGTPAPSHRVAALEYTQEGGGVCNAPNQPPPVLPPSVPPPYPPSAPIVVTPPPPLPQIPLQLSWVIHAPVTLANNISVQIPVTGIINLDSNLSVPINIPFTLSLPDLNVDFSAAFNPSFTAVFNNGQLRNWPPASQRPDAPITACPEPTPPSKPQFKIEERVVGCYLLVNPNATIRGKTIVPRGSSVFDQSVYPRIGHVQFIFNNYGFARSASVPATERFGYVACPDAYGADSVQFHPEPGVPTPTLFAVRRPVAIPINEDGNAPIGFSGVTVI